MKSIRNNFLIIFLLLLGISLTNKINGQVSLKPARLNYGDTIGLIAPGWMITEEQLKESIDQITQLGFVPFYTERILGKDGYFSGTDEQRAKDINEMFLNPHVKGIFCTNGGYGCTRILDLIDYQAIKENPKILIGYSDITALLNAVNQKTHLVTFHGPISRTVKYEYSASQLEKVLINPQKKLTIESYQGYLEYAKDKPEYNRYTITPGIATGELVGGNLTLITSMIGTEYQLDFKDKIVFIEDIGEEPYRIDRMLTQLIETGELQKASGIVFGIMKGCEKSEESKAPNSFTLREVIEERIKPLNIPSVYGLSFGHLGNNFTIPIGIKAKLDADKQTIQLLENAVK